MKITISTIFSVLLINSPAFAKNAAASSQNGIFFNVFIGTCALIVVAQLVPLLILVLGFIKASVSYVKAKETVVNESSAKNDYD